MIYDYVRWHSGKNKPLRTENVSVVSRARLTSKDHKDIFCGKKVFYILTVVIYMTTCYCQNSQNCKLKEMNSPACKLYLDKTEFNFKKIFKKLMLGENIIRIRTKSMRKKKSYKKKAQLPNHNERNLKREKGFKRRWNQKIKVKMSPKDSFILAWEVIGKIRVS